MKKYIFAAFAAIMAFALTSCSSTELENAPYSEPVSNVTFSTVKRDLVINWTNPLGSTGTSIAEDGKQIAAVGEGIDTYTVKNAADSKDHAFTLKAIYENVGRISEGYTFNTLIEYNFVPTEGRKVALVIPADYAASGSETKAYEWFVANYVDKKLGDVITADQIEKLDIEEYDRAWVIADRSGIGLGYDKLPGVGTDAAIAILRSFAKYGGNLILTNQATQLVAGISRIDEKYAPKLFGDGAGGPNPDVWGSNGVIGNREGEIYDHTSHPLYAGLEKAPYTYGHDIYPLCGNGYKSDRNCMWDVNSGDYGFAENPNRIKNFEDKTNSVVLGTWQHVVDYCCAGIVEFQPTADYPGKVLCVGVAAYDWNAETYETNNIKNMTANAINYLKYVKE